MKASEIVGIAEKEMVFVTNLMEWLIERVNQNGTEAQILSLLRIRCAELWCSNMREHLESMLEPAAVQDMNKLFANVEVVVRKQRL